jgi:hypothetical protein
VRFAFLLHLVTMVTDGVAAEKEDGNSGRYFLVGDFSVKVLHEGKARYRQLSKQLGKNMTAPCRGNPGPQHSAKFSQIPKLPLCSVGTLDSFRAESCAKQARSPTPNLQARGARLGCLDRLRYADHWTSTL